jgi:hypothetical protein
VRGEKVIMEMEKKDLDLMTRRFTEEAVDFIERNARNPFFLYLPHTMVHGPHHVSPEFQGRTGKGLYADGVAEIDWSVGRILNKLVELGIAQNTLVLFTSDNGGPLFKNMNREFSSNKPHSGGKATPAEGGFRVPAIAWWPGTIQAGESTNLMASTLDLLPSFAALSGEPFDPPKPIDGLDLSSIFSGSLPKTSPRQTFAYYAFHMEPKAFYPAGTRLYAVREGKWKYYLKPCKFLREGTQEYINVPEGALYDLTSDPGETKNVAASYSRIVKKLQRLAGTYIDKFGDDGENGPAVRKAGFLPEARPMSREAQRIFYKPDPGKTGYMWDVWLHQEEGQYYLYYLSLITGETHPGHDNIALAVSGDGVSWKEHGIVVPLSPDGWRMGSAGIWESTGQSKLPRFLMNLQETRGDREVVMFTLGSEDLIHWKDLGEAYTYGPDPGYYTENGRWVGISVVPAPQGGYYGYWTASPKEGYDRLFGFGYSPDGASWEMLPAPEVKGLGPGAPREVGGAALIDGKYYLLFCTYQGEMQVMAADRPEGPFYVQGKNVKFLFGQTHFARFTSGTDEPLVAHHIIAPSGLDKHPECFFAPLKAVDIDEEGIMRLAYWEGNDRLKTREVEVSIPKQERDENERLVMFENRFDTDYGLVLEGYFSDMKRGRFLSLDQGLYIETDPVSNSGIGIMIKSWGVTQIGTMKGDASGFRMDSFINRQVGYGANPHFRLLLRGSLLEFYINDLLVQCYSMPDDATGRIGFIHNGNPESVSRFKAWN